MKPQKPKSVYPARGFFVLILGMLISALPLIWPLTTTDYDPNYGKFPLWVMANCGVITLASVYSLIIICCLRRWGFLWIPIIGVFLIGLSLLAGFAFWALGFFLFPVAPVLLIAVSVLTALPKKPTSEQGSAHQSTTAA